MNGNSTEGRLHLTAAGPALKHQQAGLHSREPIEALLADGLDEMACAMIIVNRAFRIVHANAAGTVLVQHYLLRNPVGHAAPGAPIALHRCLAPALTRVIADVRQGISHDAAAADGGARFVKLSENGTRALITPLIAHVRAVGRPMEKSGGRLEYAHAIVAVPTAPPLSAEEGRAFADAYGLTEAETRVLVTLANGASQQEAATALAISKATLTTHIKHIFDKTGIRRQAQLVSLFLRNLSPLRR